MIFDKIENLHLYANVHKDMPLVIGFFSSHDLKTMPAGKYPIGEESYINLFEFDVPDSKVYETHRNFIDVQCSIIGNEKILWQEAELMTVTKPYNPENDCTFGEAEAGATVILKENTFAMYFPSDAHCPGVKHTAEKMRKAVFKLKI